MADEKASTASEWAKAVTPRPLLLPSGITIMVRPRSALAMAVKGRGAFDLVNLAIKAQLPDADKNLSEEEKKALADNDKGFDLASFIVDTVVEHVLTPKIVIPDPEKGIKADPEKEEIDFGLISDVDLCAIYFDATGQMPGVGGLTGSVEKFRDQWSVPRQRTGGGAVRPKTKRVN